VRHLREWLLLASAYELPIRDDPRDEAEFLAREIQIEPTPRSQSHRRVARGWMARDGGLGVPDRQDCGGVGPSASGAEVSARGGDAPERGFPECDGNVTRPFRHAALDSS
jgi:hypothetical protein